jgi:nitrogen-specific signal transduction histidine kinase
MVSQNNVVTPHQVIQEKKTELYGKIMAKKKKSSPIKSTVASLAPQTGSAMHSDMFRLMSHQIKSPINSITTLLRTVADGFAGDIAPQAHQFIERAILRVDDARQIINDIFTYEFFSESSAALTESVDVIGILLSMIDSLQIAVSEKKISFNHTIDHTHAVILKGNKAGLENALRNIVENAIKYSPENKEIAIVVSCNAPKKLVTIKISDQGYGIALDELETIFQPFYRSSQHKSSISGTGLGLPIAKRIVEAHGGTISVSSVVDEGSTFNIVLPYEHSRKSHQTRVRRKKIVIVGGVTGGPKAAARLRRLDEYCDISIIEMSEFLSYPGCGLPSFISGKVRSPKALMSTADNTIRDVNFFKTIKNITIHNKTEAIEIDREKKCVIARSADTKKTLVFPYDKLILATGSISYMPEIEGINHPRLY